MKQKIIIFVGHDESGKTSIAKELSKITNIPYFKNYNEKRKQITDSNLYGLYYESPLILQLCQQTGYSFIFDRSYPCEYAYSQTYNRKTDINFLLKIYEEFSKLATYIIFCYKTKLENFSDEMVNYDQIEKIKENYSKFYELTKCKKLLLDTTNEDLHTQLIYLIDFINDTQ